MSKAQCKNCKEIIESKHRHDFVVCKCRRESDELNQRFRMKLEEYYKQGLNVGDDHNIHLACCAFEEIIGHGFFLDGGDSYLRYGGNMDDVEILEDNSPNPKFED